VRPDLMRRWGVAAAAAALLVAIAGCSSAAGSLGSAAGSGTPVTRQYDFTGFKALSLDNACDATVVRGDAYAVSVTVDDNLAKHLQVQVDGDTLSIGLDPRWTYTGATLTAKVTMPSLTGLETDGAAKAAASGFAAGDDLDLRLSGGSTVALTGARAGKVSLNVSGAGGLTGELQAQEIGGEATGAGRVSLQGSASRAKLEASGAGRLDLGELALHDADLNLSGGASGTVRVSGTLKVEASGGARLEYYGSPTLGKMNVSGGAQVNTAGG
jgi:hypothetical protein